MAKATYLVSYDLIGKKDYERLFEYLKTYGTRSRPLLSVWVIVTDKITYQGQAEIKRDLEVYKEALQGLQFEEAFVPAATPSRSDEDPEHIYLGFAQQLAVRRIGAGGDQGPGGGVTNGDDAIEGSGQLIERF